MPPLITITECPRDAFQGLAKFIPTEEKIAYMNALTDAGCRRIDFGSFVSPKAVPQMADTAVVFENMRKPAGLYLIGIIGNERGLEGLLACNGKFRAKGLRIAAAGYPLSVSETFQQRNLGRGIEQSWEEFSRIAAKAKDHGVDVVCYLSMAFGNPYGDPHSAEIVEGFARRVAALGVTTISLADTIGNATPEMIGELFRRCIAACPGVEITAHFHSTPESFAPKIDAAVDAGCTLIDSAIGGIGGCPFAKDKLTGNIDTLALLRHLRSRGLDTSIDPGKLAQPALMAARISSLFSG